MRKGSRKKEWHYSVAFKASLVGFLQSAKCRLGSNFEFALILADAGIQQQQQCAEPDPLLYTNNPLTPHQHHLLQQQLLQQQQQLLLQQQQQPSLSSMPCPPRNSAGSLNLEHLVGSIQKTMAQGVKTGKNRTKRHKS